MRLTPIHGEPALERAAQRAIKALDEPAKAYTRYLVSQGIIDTRYKLAERVVHPFDKYVKEALESARENP